MTIRIQCRELSKRYKLGIGRATLREMLSDNFSRLKISRNHTDNHKEILYALRDVSFDVNAGESVGLIGPNGAGKTTTLKILAGITQPSSGDLQINGKLSALIELGAGFHPDLTGRENIYLNGCIMGLSRKEITKRLDSIVAFSELEKFIDTPVKRYSSGMYARLGFSVAAHVDPAILLVDEVLSVGDMGFQNKCFQRMAQLKEQGTTLVFVSHNLNAVQQVCSRALVFFQGQIAFEGSASQAVAEYSNILRRMASSNQKPEGPEANGLAQRRMTHEAVIGSVHIKSQMGEDITVIRSGEVIKVVFDVTFHQRVSSPIFACTIRQPDGFIVYDVTTDWLQFSTPDFEAGQKVAVMVELEMNLTSGNYQLGVDLAYSDLSCYYDRLERALDFVVIDESGAKGISNLMAAFSLSDLESSLQVNENMEGLLS